jgi:hypothetical protein
MESKRHHTHKKEILRFSDLDLKNCGLEKELEELLTRFENFQHQETFLDADIHTIYLRAFDYYIATHEKGQHDKGISFANFVAGYLRAKIDGEQSNLL